MTKIRLVLLWLLIFCPFFGSGQVANEAASAWSSVQSRLVTDYTNRQAVFTVHLLAQPVEPQKKQMYELSIEGRRVSQPSPTRLETRLLRLC